MSIDYITDAVKAVIGAEVGPTLACEPVTASEVRRFFQATMDPSPRYWCHEWTKTSRYGDVVAPPAFIVHAFRSEPTSPDVLDGMVNPEFDGVSRSFHGLPEIKVPLTVHMNGGYEYEFYRYARIGERIYRTSRYKDIYQREGRSGTMVFILIEQVYTGDDGSKMLKTLSTTLLR